jgi:hypothetical protein
VPAAIDVYVERGSTRAFACAVDWPGWCRSGRDEAGALEALFASAPRYARAMKRKRVPFAVPKDPSALRVTGRLKGTSTTDFGAPGVSPAVDARRVGASGLRELGRVLEACWAEFDAMAKAAKGETLRVGPRGGGRDLAKMTSHLIEADLGYLGALGWKHMVGDAPPSLKLQRTRRAMLEGIAASARGEIPARGPRGGVRSKPRYIVRRSAWHWLDHAWEIEDRVS